MQADDCVTVHGIAFGFPEYKHLHVVPQVTISAYLDLRLG
jgi:hypothetical protein